MVFARTYSSFRPSSECFAGYLPASELSTVDPSSRPRHPLHLIRAVEAVAGEVKAFQCCDLCTMHQLRFLAIYDLKSHLS